MKPLTLDDREFAEADFWRCFTALSFPTAWEEETDQSLADIVEELRLADIAWWNAFTRYDAETFELTDGYLSDPTTLVCPFAGRTLKIEFHPGDIVYYLDNEQIGCTGPHYQIQRFPFGEVADLSDPRLFLLLLPLATVGEQERTQATKIIAHGLTRFFDASLCDRLAQCIVEGLAEV